MTINCLPQVMHALTYLREQAVNVQVIFIAFETLRRPQNVDAFIQAWKLSLPEWQKEVAEALKMRTGISTFCTTIDPWETTEI